jgi:hypothetical protein
VTFNIRSQQGGIINNVIGDQRIDGGQHGAYASGGDVTTAVAQLRAALAGSSLSDDVVQSATAQIDEVERAAAGDQPDRRRVATALEKLTRILVAAGPLATAATAFAAPLGALAAWLGPLGQGLARVIPAL